jgi:DNA processing protein
MNKYWIWLSQIPYIGPRTAKDMLQIFRTPENIYFAKDEELINNCNISAKQLKMIKENRSLEASLRILDNCNKNGIHILTIQDDRYPVCAKNSDAPLILYYKGKLFHNHAAIGIVGARRCTREDRQATIEKAELYAKQNITVISGMAKGVDSYAHTACLKAGGYTIAVLANGLDICYPREHNILMRSIEEQGLLLSEYPPGVRPASYRFPQRNRIISSWSDQLIVIGAGRGSGALITADYAHKYGKAVQYISSV